MNPTHIICHYSEIGLKGKNRKFFEDRLRENIKHGLNTLEADVFTSVQRLFGRILISLHERSYESMNEITEILNHTFGIAYFAYAVRVSQQMEVIINTAKKILTEKPFKTFRITARRADRSFPIGTQKINEVVGLAIVDQLGKQVKLKKPDITCYIDIVEGSAFLYTKRFPGPGGLPVGVSGKTVVMISGGIDSPVAAYYALKRGTSPRYVHFHSVPYTNQASIDKVREIVQRLNIFQRRSKIYFVQFAPIQKEIMTKTKAKFRVILYRRFMVRIAEAIALNENAPAIITGESLGQVASQTLENIKVIEEVTSIPILRPLIGFDKQEIVNRAKTIGTYDISILPDQDCCSLFIPKHPSTKAKINDVIIEEKRLDIDHLIDKALSTVEIEIIE